MKSYMDLSNKLLIAILSFFFISSLFSSVAFAEHGDPSTLGIGAVERDSAGNYIYQISGHLGEGSFAEYNWNLNLTDYVIVVEIGGTVVHTQNLMTGYADDVGVLEQSAPVLGGVQLLNSDVSFDYTVALNTGGIATVKIVEKNIGYDHVEQSRTVDLTSARAALDAAADGTGAAAPNPSIPGLDPNAPLPPGYVPPAGDTVAAPSVTATCQDWSTVKDIETIGQCFAEWGALANRFLIGIAVLGSIFLLPWIGYLWASGQTGNVEKGWEMFNAWFWGLLLLLMSGFIITILGKDLFGVS